MAGSVSSGYDDDEPLSDINVTPLVDVTLVLLIVFMITVPAIVGLAPLKVNLPESSAIPPEAVETPLVFMLKRGSAGGLELYLNDQRIDEAGVRRLLSDGTPPADREVTLAAERGILWDDVVEFVDLLKSLGVEKVSLPTQHVESR